MQAGPAALGIGLGAHQRQAESHALEFETELVSRAAVQTGKSVDARTTDRQQVDIDLAGRLLDRAVGVERAVGQRHRLAGALDRKIALDLEEAEDIELEVAAGLHQLALGAVQRQRQRAAATGVDRQRGRTARVVDDRVARLGRLVDVDRHAAGADRQVAAQADKCHALGSGLQTGPLAGRGLVAAGHFLAHQRQPELHAGQLKSELVSRAAVQAREGVDARATDCQQVDIDLAGSSLDAAVSILQLVSQRHRFAAALDREVALDLEESIDVQRQVAAGLHQFTLDAVHRQRQARARTGGDRELILGVVHDDGGCAAGLVDRHAQVGRADLQVIAHADEVNASGGGLQAGPLARRSLARRTGELLAHQRHAEIDPCERQAHRVVSTAANAGKCRHLARA